MRVIKNAEAKEMSVGQPVAVTVVQHIKCDRDQSCDYAKFEVVTPSGPLYLCGHHFHANKFMILFHKYEVKKTNA